MLSGLSLPMSHNGPLQLQRMSVSEIENFTVGNSLILHCSGTVRNFI